MKQLTDEQVKRAARAYYDEVFKRERCTVPWESIPSQEARVKDALRAAAPYLQMQWDKPTDGEWQALKFCDHEESRRFLAWLRDRNAALLPPPPPPNLLQERLFTTFLSNAPHGESEQWARRMSDIAFKVFEESEKDSED